MMQTIYQDDKRTITADKGYLAITATSGTRRVPIDAVVLPLPKGAADVLRQRGEDPATYYGLGVGSVVMAVLPDCTRDAIRAAASAYKAEQAAVRAEPWLVARNEIRALFAAAERKRDYPGDYFLALHKAQAAYATWRTQYPEAAREEDRAELVAQAEREDQAASDAMLYDADGSLSREDREAAAAEYRVKAAELRERAAAL